MNSIRFLAILSVLAWGQPGCASGPRRVEPEGGAAQNNAGATPPRWTYASPEEAARYGQAEATVRSLDPCSDGYAPRCSENGQWFNCDCENAQGNTDPRRDWWSQVSLPDTLLGRLWQYSLDQPMRWGGAREAQWQAVRADALQRAGTGYAAQLLRLTERGTHLDWAVYLRHDATTAVLHYNEVGVFQSEERSTFHPD